MAADIELVNVTRDETGTLWTVTVRAIDPNNQNKPLTKTIQVTGATKIEIKDALRPKIQTFIDQYNAQQTVWNTAQEGISELRVEFSLPLT